MKDKKLLIVGIDPGMTTAIAVLDIDGNLIYVNSSKQLNLESLISCSLNFGKVVLVGTDKSKVPSLVETFATKIGARIICPEEDIKVSEKRLMTHGFKLVNEHQLDALASALFTYKSIKPLLDKIDFFVKENKKHGIKDRVKEIVITKRLSIKNAAALIEKKEEPESIIEKVVAQKILSEEDFLKLYGRLKKYESELKIIRRYNNKLKNSLSSLEKTQIKDIPQNDGKLADFREKRAKSLENVIRIKNKEIERLKTNIGKLNFVMSNIGNFYILKKLDNLGIREFSFKNRILNIKKNDIILVDDPNIASEEVVESLRDNVFVIVHKKPVS